MVLEEKWLHGPRVKSPENHNNLKSYIRLKYEIVINQVDSLHMEFQVKADYFKTPSGIVSSGSIMMFL
jgi:hypothetical protein